MNNIENFVTDFNVATNLTLYVLFTVFIIAVFMRYAARVDNKVQSLKSKYNIDDKTDKTDYPKEYIEKYTKLDKIATVQFVITIIIIITTANSININKELQKKSIRG